MKSSLSSRGFNLITIPETFIYLLSFAGDVMLFGELNSFLPFQRVESSKVAILTSRAGFDATRARTPSSQRRAKASGSAWCRCPASGPRFPPSGNSLT